MSLNQSRFSRPKAGSMFLPSDEEHLWTRDTSQTETFYTLLFASFLHSFINLVMPADKDISISLQ